MKKFAIVIYCLLCSQVVGAQSGKGIERPKLVVGVVIDQMRWDYLYRYYDRYGSDGFKKVMGEGYNCQNTMINFIPSATGPGHACVYTGSVPAIHGIVANEWLDRATGKSWYCVEDANVQAVGGSSKAGMMSPRNLYTSTVTDELRLATNMKGKVFGLGIKDRGSILPAGHKPNGAFWFDDSTGNFISSSYYMNVLPAWLNTFNGKNLADKYTNEVWKPLYDISTYTNSIDDDNPYEGNLPGEKHPVFPHAMSGSKTKGYKSLRYLPGGNSITFDLAEACIQGEELGKDDVTDMLCVTLSTTDYAGHNYAPNAIEMEDMYLRLDQDMARFIQYLDKNIGKGKYTLFITADHGAAHNANYLSSLNIPSGMATEHDVEQALEHYLQSVYNVPGLIKAVSSYQVHLNEKLIANNGISRDTLKTRIQSWLQKQNGVASVVDIEHLKDIVLPEPIKTMVINSVLLKRNGSLLIIPQPGWYSGYAQTGTTHGSWNPYDTHIPLLWYGWGINKGVSYDRVNMTDIAATVAALLHIQMPNGCVGSVIDGVIAK